VGLITSPLLLTTGAKYIVVSGFRRIYAGRHLGWSSIEARVADPGTEKIEYVRYAITDNALQRPLNLIETSRSFGLLSVFFKDINRMTAAASELGLPGNPSIIKKIQALCHLPLLIQNYILADTISLAMAEELQQMDSDEGIVFASLFNNLRLSLNKQREIITLVKEVALREDISIRQLLDENGFLNIINDDNLNRTQKTQQIRFYWRQRRFPTLVRAEKEFKELVNKLSLGSNIQLFPPKNFEGNEYSLRLNFTNIDELQNHQHRLLKLTNDPVFKKILT